MSKRGREEESDSSRSSDNENSGVSNGNGWESSPEPERRDSKRKKGPQAITMLSCELSPLIMPSGTAYQQSLNLSNALADFSLGDRAVSPSATGSGAARQGPNSLPSGGGVSDASNHSPASNPQNPKAEQGKGSEKRSKSAP